jgi:hypothetical protein
MGGSRNVRLGFGVAILTVALFFVTLTVWGTWEAGDYFRRTYPSVPASGYPVVSVAGSCVLLFSEALVLMRLLAGASMSIGRALAAFGASVGGAVILFFTLMAPDHVAALVTYHFLWLLSAAAISMGTFLTLSVAHLARLAGSRRGSG